MIRDGDVCDDLSRDPEWAAAIDVIGGHYPAAGIQPNCAALNKVQWASEDMAVSWDTGAGCWARELNQNYVRANLTAMIAWDLVNSFYDNLEFAGAVCCALLNPGQDSIRSGKSFGRPHIGDSSRHQDGPSYSTGQASDY
jgi:hypothetical protein